MDASSDGWSEVPVPDQSPAVRPDVLSATPIKSRLRCHVTVMIVHSTNNLWRPDERLKSTAVSAIKVFCGSHTQVTQYGHALE